MNSIKILTLLAFVINVQCQQGPEFFTREERMDLFLSDSVPEYEIVPLSPIRRKRNLDKDYSVVFFKAFGKNLKLYLEDEESVLIGKNTKVWTARPDKSLPGGVKYKFLSKYRKIPLKLLHDKSNMAAVTVDKDENGRIKMHGTIGDDLVIKPVPERMQGYFDYSTKQKRDISEFKKYNHQHTSAHVVYKNPILKHRRTKSKIKDFAKKAQSNFNATLDAPSVVYPEILLFMDHVLFAKLGKSVENAKKYIATYWNAVDLRFRELKNPEVRLNIAGIILSKGQRELPYINESIINEDKIDADKVLIDIGKHLYKHEIFHLGKTYDLFMAMTSLDMCNYEAEGLDCGTMGFAYTAATCNIINDPEIMVESVGMVEDNAGFKGIISTAHEVGHLLGLDHDETNDINSECYSDGYIMKDHPSFSEKGFAWSPCSLSNFSTYLNSLECVRNKPEIGVKIDPILPGKYLSLMKQCQQFQKESHPCNPKYDNVCSGLECYNIHTDSCEPIAPAAEGSPCGNKSICLNGKCIKKKRKSFKYNKNNSFDG